MTTFEWDITAYSEEERFLGSELSKELSLSPVVTKILIKRGLCTKEAIEKYFHPHLRDLHDPFLMNDMYKAVDRLNQAIGKKEKILVYGDYDVDGTTAVALVYKYLRQTGCSDQSLDYYIPDRYDEGYGISRQTIDMAYQSGVKLVIALDCGIKANDVVVYAKQLGIDFIICDHHKPDDELPPALAVLDCKRKDNLYPYEHLSGCGVGFKLMQAYALSNAFPLTQLYRHLDLLAVSIAADIVPVTGENRILAYHGLRQLNKAPCVGLRSIIEQSYDERDEKLGMDDIIFKIGPRLNASGRMMSGKTSVSLLLAKNIEEGKRLAQQIDAYNEQRRELDRLLSEEAFTYIEEHKQELLSHRIILLYHPLWHKGVIGIIASRVSERYHLPCVILTGGEQYISGSARSVAGFDIYAAIESCRELLKNFGGHPYAAGLTIQKDLLNQFYERIYAYADREITYEQTMLKLKIDAEISLSQINLKLMKELERLAPFGCDNEKPIFLTRGLKDGGWSKLVGHHKEHIKIDCVSSSSRKKHVQAIAFNLADKGKELLEGNPFDLCYSLEENKFIGKPMVQLFVRDIAVLSLSNKNVT